MSEEAKASADDAEDAAHRAKERMEKRWPVVIASIAIASCVFGAGVVYWIQDQRMASKDAAHDSEIKRLELEKLQATPLSTPEQPGAADAVQRWLKSGTTKERIDAVRLIAGNKASEPFFVPALAALLDDAEPSVRAAATCGLGRMRDDSGVVGELLASKLVDSDDAVRACAATALAVGWQGAPTNSVSTLERLWRDEAQPLRVRFYAARAMLLVDSDYSAPLLLNALEHPRLNDPQRRTAAAFALDGQGAITAKVSRSLMEDAARAGAPHVLALMAEPSTNRALFTYGADLTASTEGLLLVNYGDERVAEIIRTAVRQADGSRHRRTLAYVLEDLERTLKEQNGRP